jgi:hypothetical protein
MMCVFERCGEKNGRPICGCVNDGCNVKVYSDSPETCHAQCRGEMGWGDHVAEYLKRRWKLTECSYRMWKVRNGFRDACNCRERKQTLNWGGRKIKRLRQRIKGWLT